MQCTTVLGDFRKKKPGSPEEIPADREGELQKAKKKTPRTETWKKRNSRRMKILKEKTYCLGVEREGRKLQKQGREVRKRNKEVIRATMRRPGNRELLRAKS